MTDSRRPAPATAASVSSVQSPLRRSLLVRLLRAASLPTMAVMTAATFSGCLDADTRCFTHDADRCPLPDEAQNRIPRDCEENVVSVDSDAERNGAECCYDVTVEKLDGCVVEGRPMMIEDDAVTAAPRERSDWTTSQLAPDVTELTSDQRRKLTQLWTRTGLFEHASVASFSRFAMQLMAVGAPASLLEQAHRAALDEVNHARAAFALAGAYRGAPIGPSRLPLPDSVPVRASLSELAVSTAIEACVNETLAVLVAIEQLSRVSDPAARRVLEGIVEDESRHAALAWRTVRWAIEKGGPQVRAAVFDALSDARPTGAMDADMFSETRDETLEAHGLLDDTSRRDAMTRGFDEIIQPCIRALFSDDKTTEPFPPKAFSEMTYRA